jgi:hypothetical protein
MGLKWTVLFFVGALLSCGSCLDWQGAGNMTQDNLTIIRTKISALDLAAQNKDFAPFATTLSTELNNLWAPAWNVAIVTSDDGNNYDAVMVGYGFNGHWFWFNGMRINSGYVSFIIWKDFNCVRWITFNPSDPNYQFSSFTAIGKIFDGITAGKSGRDTNDIWSVAKDVQDKFPATDPTTLFNDKLAYTVLASQSQLTIFYGRFCAQDYIVIGQLAYQNSIYSGTALVLQMRIK